MPQPNAPRRFNLVFRDRSSDFKVCVPCAVRLVWCRDFGVRNNFPQSASTVRCVFVFRRKLCARSLVANVFQEDSENWRFSSSYVVCLALICTFIHSLVFSLRGRVGRNQSPVLWPVWLLAHCILGKLLGVVCHCFPPPLDVPTFAASCLYVRNDARDPTSERWKCGREICQVILPKFRLPLKFRDFYMPQIYDMGPTALLPLRRKACWGFFSHLHICKGKNGEVHPITGHEVTYGE